MTLVRSCCVYSLPIDRLRELALAEEELAVARRWRLAVVARRSWRWRGGGGWRVEVVVVVDVQEVGGGGGGGGGEQAAGCQLNRPSPVNDCTAGVCFYGGSLLFEIRISLVMQVSEIPITTRAPHGFCRPVLLVLDIFSIPSHMHMSRLCMCVFTLTPRMCARAGFFSSFLH